MIRWGYLTVFRSRVWARSNDQARWYSGTPWRITGAFENQGWEDRWDEFLNMLGAQGWELVTVETRSSYAGMPGEASDFAGLTTEDMWIFKRPQGQVV